MAFDKTSVLDNLANKGCNLTHTYSILVTVSILFTNLKEWLLFGCVRWSKGPTCCHSRWFDSNWWNSDWLCQGQFTSSVFFPCESRYCCSAS